VEAEQQRFVKIPLSYSATTAILQQCFKSKIINDNEISNLEGSCRIHRTCTHQNFEALEAAACI